MNLNMGSAGIVRLNGEQSIEFKMERGIRQGDNLSTLLIVIYMNFMNTLCKNLIKKPVWDT